MMIKRLLSVQRIGLRLLILNFLIFPLILNSQEKEEGLELPKVVIYGKYFGKMQFSPKKDFYTYLSTGNLFPISRVFSPEVRFPPHRKVPGDVQRITDYWVLLDAGAGNWWADRIFLNCGLRNPSGLLSVQLKDFRRKGWAKDHSENSDFLEIKGVLNQENYYISGNIFYDYGKLTREGADSLDTVAMHNWGIGLHSLLDFGTSHVKLFGRFSSSNYHNSFVSSDYGELSTVREDIHNYSVHFNGSSEVFYLSSTIIAEGVSKIVLSRDTGNSNVVTTINTNLRLTLSEICLSPGISFFHGDEKISAAPLVVVRATVPDVQLYPFLTYSEKRRINTFLDIYGKYPFIPFNEREYTVLSERNITIGFEGARRKFSYYFGYSHINLENYPILYAPMLEVVTYRNVAKDIVKANITIDAKNCCISLAGCYTLGESILYEPALEFDMKVEYKGPHSIVPHAGIMSKFGIRTLRFGVGEVNVFSLNAGISYEIIKDLTLKLEVENILDQRYEIWEGYTEGGIQFFLSFKYKVMK